MALGQPWARLASQGPVHRSGLIEHMASLARLAQRLKRALLGRLGQPGPAPRPIPESNRAFLGLLGQPALAGPGPYWASRALAGPAPGSFYPVNRAFLGPLGPGGPIWPWASWLARLAGWPRSSVHNSDSGPSGPREAQNHCYEPRIWAWLAGPAGWLAGWARGSKGPFLTLFWGPFWAPFLAPPNVDSPVSGPEEALFGAQKGPILGLLGPWPNWSGYLISSHFAGRLLHFPLGLTPTFLPDQDFS